MDWKRPVGPLRPHLDLGQRLLATGAAPDVLIQALETGLVDPATLNGCVGDVSLIQRWLAQAKSHWLDPLDGVTGPDGQPVGLDWPMVDTPQGLVGGRQVTAEALWTEHALVRLVGAGLDPLQPFDPELDPGQSNLLEWAHAQGRPWVLQACLGAVTAEQARTLVATHAPGKPALPRLHHALATDRPLIAQAWLGAGADGAGKDGMGRTPVFHAVSVRGLEWALAHGSDLGDRDPSGASPMACWRTQADGQWTGMIGLAARDGAMDSQYGAVMEGALRTGDLQAIKQMKGWKDAGLLPCGLTPLGLAGEMALARWSRRAGQSGRRANGATQVLAWLWPRANLEVAQGNVRAGVSDLAVAALASRCVGKTAQSAMDRLKDSRTQAVPDVDQAIARVEHVLDPPPTARTTESPRSLLHRWYAQQVLDLAVDGDLKAAAGGAGRLVPHLPADPAGMHATFVYLGQALALIALEPESVDDDTARQALAAALELVGRVVPDDYEPTGPIRGPLPEAELPERLALFAAQPVHIEGVDAAAVAVVQWVGRGVEIDPAMGRAALERLEWCVDKPEAMAAAPRLRQAILESTIVEGPGPARSPMRL